MNTEDGIFPIGMRVLIVDNDTDALTILQTQLQECQYHVTTETEAITAMKLLQNGKQKFDLILMDSNMLGMEGRQLFENVASYNIPFILLSSSNITKELVMKGVSYGACDFISKPARPYELQNIWRHMIRRRNELKARKPKKLDSTSVESFQTPNKLTVIENVNCRSRKTYGKRKTFTNEECDEKIKRVISLKDKKRRVVWSPDLHQKFIAIVERIGLENSVPKKILELMSDENLTRENVASHLQKYRLSLKKSSHPVKETTSTSIGGGSAQNFSGIVNDVQSISNSRSASQTYTPGVFSSQRVTQWGQACNVMSINDNICTGSQMERQNMFHCIPTPTVELDSANQPYVASVPFVSAYPSGMGDFNEFHHEWTQTQSPRLSLSCHSNDSTDNRLTCASGNFDACSNENELYDLNSNHFGFYNHLTDYKTIVDPELSSDGSTFFGENYNLLRGMNIDDDSQIVNGGMQSNLKLQKHEDDYIPMQPR